MIAQILADCSQNRQSAKIYFIKNVFDRLPNVMFWHIPTPFQCHAYAVRTALSGLSRLMTWCPYSSQAFGTLFISTFGQWTLLFAILLSLPSQPTHHDVHAAQEFTSPEMHFATHHCMLQGGLHVRSWTELINVKSKLTLIITSNHGTECVCVI